jgi:hypothetical protein
VEILADFDAAVVTVGVFVFVVAAAMFATIAGEMSGSTLARVLL